MDYTAHGILLATGVGSLSFLQGIFPTQGLNPGLLRRRQILYQMSHKGSPRILEWVAYPFSSRSSQPRNELGSPALQADSLPTELSGKLIWAWGHYIQFLVSVRILLVWFVYLSTVREVQHKAAGWPLLLSFQWEAVCPGATSCHAVLLPNTLRAGLTPTPCGPPVPGLSSSSVWFDIDCLKPSTYDSAKLNEKERVTIREGVQFWRPELWKEVTVLGAFLVCHGWGCHYRQQQCSHYF